MPRRPTIARSFIHCTHAIFNLKHVIVMSPWLATVVSSYTIHRMCFIIRIVEFQLYILYSQ